MSKTTDNLNLFEYDVETDAKKTFNIQQSMNDNFDKIDAFAGNVPDKDLSNLSTTGQGVIDAKVSRSYGDKLFNRIYDGENLETKFASEIANFSSVYAWIKARINVGDYTGINIGDYFNVTMSAGTVGSYTVAQQTFQCQVAGIDTYTGCGDTEIGHHIDFISREVIDTAMTWNPSNCNNGSSTENRPWLQSGAYALLNGVNNYRKGYSLYLGASASGKGVLQLLPSSLTSLIVNKRMLLDSRYSSSGNLSCGTTWTWGDMGALWLPNEIEVYGCQNRGVTGLTSGWWNPESNMTIAYPIYLASGRNRIKKTSGGARSSWWLSSVVCYSSASVCYVNGYGYASGINATDSPVRFPLCFRL